MNKALRHQMKMSHYLRRLRNLGLREGDNVHAYRTSGKPCSCWCCSPEHNGPPIRDRRRMNEDIED